MSKPPRFFISPEQVLGDRITITGEDLRHITTVLRKRTGDELLLSDGQGREYAVKIIEAHKAEIVTRIEARSTQSIRAPRIILGQGLPKSDKMDWIVQKATELGVSTIVPLVTERTIVKIRDEEKRTARWQKIAREAAMQSRRPDIPVVGPVEPFALFLRNLVPGPRTLLLFPWEDGTEPVKTVLLGEDVVATVIVLIGPEGGFSESEAAQARGKGFRLVSLGPNILRTETAAIAVLGMIQYQYF